MTNFLDTMLEGAANKMAQDLDDEVTEGTVHRFESGSVRSGDKADYAYHLISPIGLRRLAMTYQEGSHKYGDDNWKKGQEARELMRHVIAHCYDWLEGKNDEDDLAHAAWGLFTIMHFEETRPELIDIPERHPVDPNRWKALTREQRSRKQIV